MFFFHLTDCTAPYTLNIHTDASTDTLSTAIPASRGKKPI
jgi:hypothetical protein